MENGKTQTFSSMLFSQLNRFLPQQEIYPQPIPKPQPIDPQWIKDCTEMFSKLEYIDDYHKSSQQLREIIKSGILKFTAIRDEPEKFFAAHRILAEQTATQNGPGFAIRCTVQYNLFAGTILGMASKEQLTILDEIQEKGQLGCFALTEKFAGVNSGMVVNTEIEYIHDKQVFILNTPNKGAEKNWISQGFTADKAVVIANLKIGDKLLGPHGFLMDFRDENGKLMDNITVTDMGRKTIGNDLDNASIHFDHVQLPKTALLTKFCQIDENGEYQATIKGVKPFDMIGQRLFTGRVAIAQAAAKYQQCLFRKTKEYTDNKLCWGPKGKTPTLSSIPQLTELYEEEAKSSAQMWVFMYNVEAQLNECLRENKIPSMKLIEAIAVCKVKAVELAIDYCFRLKQEVGSYALMDGTGFENMDFITCCKFAEGDSRILMLKMARDRMNLFKKKLEKGGSPDDKCPEEQIVAKFFFTKMDRGAQFKEMMKLAHLIMNRYMAAYTS